LPYKIFRSTFQQRWA